MILTYGTGDDSLFGGCGPAIAKGEQIGEPILKNVDDLSTYDLEEMVAPTLDVLQQIDANELLTPEDLGLPADDFLIQDLGDIF